MNRLLTDSMRERADALNEYRPDLMAIVTQGDVRVRRRRTGVVLGGAATLMTVAILPALVHAGSESRRVDAAGSVAGGVIWSEGSVVHRKDRTVDLGREIHAFVQSDRGYVFSDPTMSVWSWVDGQLSQVGAMRDDWRQRLVAEESYAAWLDVSEPQWGFVILDQRTGERVTVPAEVPEGVMGTDADTDPQLSRLRDYINVQTIDGATLYALDARGILAIDVEDGSVDVLRQPATRQLVVDDVEDGHFLFSEATDGRAHHWKTYAGNDLSPTSTSLGVQGGDLSPGSGYVMSENSAGASDDFTVIDLSSNAPLPAGDKAEYDFFTGYAWLDADTYAAYGVSIDRTERRPTVVLLSCEVSTGDCTPESGPFTWGDVQLPTGNHLSD